MGGWESGAGLGELGSCCLLAALFVGEYYCKGLVMHTSGLVDHGSADGNGVD